MMKFLLMGFIGGMVLFSLSCQKAGGPEKAGERKGMKAGSSIPACGKDFEFREGDIIFQTSMSSRGKAIQLATHSEFSHVGVITLRKGKPQVYEAVETVRLTPLEEWIRGGENGKFAVKRLGGYDSLPHEVIKGMRKAARKFAGKSYDPYFGWSDEKMYCSELVYKIYRAGGVEVGTPQKLKDLDLSHPSVKEMLKERFGGKVPYDETVITPASIYNDEELTAVCSNY